MNPLQKRQLAEILAEAALQNYHENSPSPQQKLQKVTESKRNEGCSIYLSEAGIKTSQNPKPDCPSRYQTTLYFPEIMETESTREKDEAELIENPRLFLSNPFTVLLWCSAALENFSLILAHFLSLPVSHNASLFGLWILIRCKYHHQFKNIENTHNTGNSASVPTSSKKHKPEANCGARRRKNRSEVWDHFEKLEEEEDEGDVDAVTEEMTYLDLNASTSQGGSNEPFQVD
ncbi:hypothetical protein Cgig2_015404 [Carnegiea gigantea]|uniref:Uncharacterized protein n=1 Tax=Carnegiea gigantea TaxID=171969 RepID=A0A9Q1K2Y2_9CARY|nr:hypothetical protein Cgig2_015404 [Carnegiea gigantea]